MKNSHKIVKKSETNWEQNGGWLVTIFGNVFRVQQEIVAMLNKKWKYNSEEISPPQTTPATQNTSTAQSTTMRKEDHQQQMTASTQH